MIRNKFRHCNIPAGCIDVKLISVMYYKSIIPSNYSLIKGLCPYNPTSFFSLDEKNEARKIKTKRLPPALLKDRNF
jgi:hypothetical protein